MFRCWPVESSAEAFGFILCYKTISYAHLVMNALAWICLGNVLLFVLSLRLTLNATSRGQQISRPRNNLLDRRWSSATVHDRELLYTYNYNDSAVSRTSQYIYPHSTGFHFTCLICSSLFIFYTTVDVLRECKEG